jgi:glucose-6-phosphate isomerase
MKKNDLDKNANLTELAFSFLNKPLVDLFKEDSLRAEKFSVSCNGLSFDFSKQLLDQNVLNKLIELAAKSSLKEAIAKLYNGEAVNTTESRPALHTALRAPKEKRSKLGNEDVSEIVHEQLGKMASMVAKIHSAQWRGYTGKPITDVVNIGVGGSDLGPFMVVEALHEYANESGKALGVHFVSSMDGSQIFKLLERLERETTLFVICSKSFTTVDTFYNADTAISWLLEGTGNTQLIMAHHVVGVSSNSTKMAEWGIPESNQLLFWDWVGGRFSMWSTIGFSVALKLGMECFYQILEGAHMIDLHFLEAPLDKNIPVIMGLIGVWNSSFLEFNAHSVLPYDGRLRFLPNYLTQLEMESNGKSAKNDGTLVNYKTCPILWGEIGSNAQHAFYQLLHQGTQKVSCDFIAPIRRYRSEIVNREDRTNASLKNQHRLSLANCLAQSRVLAFGNDAIDGAIENNHKRYRGNQPSSTLLMEELNPHNLGALIALYEHKVFVMASIWEINPFDQWGVELGKKLSYDTLSAMNGDDSMCFDSSTDYLINLIRKVDCQEK